MILRSIGPRSAGAEPCTVPARVVAPGFAPAALAGAGSWDDRDSAGVPACEQAATNINHTIVDPKAFDPKSFVDLQGPSCIIPPNSFALGRTVEYIRMPRNALAVCIGKSTMARCGIIVNVTPIEPAWEGHITIEISNTTPLPCKIYANEGIAQLLFFQAEDCERSYADKRGKYQKQIGITLPRI